MKRDYDLREAEKDLCFALGKLQSGLRVSAYLNALMAIIHIGQSMSESEHQTALLEVARLTKDPECLKN